MNLEPLKREYEIWNSVLTVFIIAASVLIGYYLGGHNHR